MISTKEYPCNWFAYYTSRPIVLLLGFPLYTKKGLYIPHIMIAPLLIVWPLLGIVVIAVFGGVAMLVGKEQELMGVWF
jgi:hypothetical protein